MVAGRETPEAVLGPQSRCDAARVYIYRVLCTIYIVYYLLRGKPHLRDPVT